MIKKQKQRPREVSARRRGPRARALAPPPPPRSFTPSALPRYTSRPQLESFAINIRQTLRSGVLSVAARWFVRTFRYFRLVLVN